MAKKSSIVAIKTYDDTWDKPIKPYKAVDLNGRKIIIQPKNKTKHESEHPIEQMPTYFYNLDLVIANPDRIEEPSKTPTAIKNSKNGKHYVFIKNGYVSSLNIPGQFGENEQTKVIVYYGNDGNNFTRSYRTEAKTNE